MKQKTLSTIGEFGIIDIIASRFKKIAEKNIAASLGDDAFSFIAGKEIISITKDMLIEDIHFKKDWISPFDLGKKSIEVNISDLAAMGGAQPKYIFIGFGAPSDTEIVWIKEFASGIFAACNKYGAKICGGDTVRADKITISITALGISEKIITRSGAKDGDLIGITNFCGNSAAGLDLLSKYGAKYHFNRDEKNLIKKHNQPIARLKEGAVISDFANSMTDSSDGLFVSISLLADASKKGAEIFIDKIPISPQLKRTVADKDKMLSYLLFGGEDFELAFTLRERKAEILKKLLPQISFIGRIKSKKGITFKEYGKKIKIDGAAFKHF